jgi:hypothetical protein
VVTNGSRRRDLSVTKTKAGSELVYSCAKHCSEPSSDKRGTKADALHLTPLELINRIAASAASRDLPAPGLLIRKPAPSAAGASPPALPAELAATIANLPTEMNCENRINKVFTILAASIEMQFQITVKGIS